MSASDPDSSVFLGDTPKQIARKIGGAFSGGQETRELHRRLGGRADVDIPFQYLRFFFEDDDELEAMRVRYEKGEMETGELKGVCTRTMQTYVAEFKERRGRVTEEVRREFLRPRPLVFKGSPFLEERTEDAAKGNKEMKIEAKDIEIEVLRKGIVELQKENEVLRKERRVAEVEVKDAAKGDKEKEIEALEKRLADLKAGG